MFHPKLRDPWSSGTRCSWSWRRRSRSSTRCSWTWRCLLSSKGRSSIGIDCQRFSSLVISFNCWNLTNHLSQNRRARGQRGWVHNSGLCRHQKSSWIPTKGAQVRLKKKRRHYHSSTNSCFQEEDNDDPLCPDQRPLGNLDGPQVHRDHVNPKNFI